MKSTSASCVESQAVISHYEALNAELERKTSQFLHASASAPAHLHEQIFQERRSRSSKSRNPGTSKMHKSYSLTEDGGALDKRRDELLIKLTKHNQVLQAELDLARKDLTIVVSEKNQLSEQLSHVKEDAKLLKKQAQMRDQQIMQLKSSTQQAMQRAKMAEDTQLALHKELESIRREAQERTRDQQRTQVRLQRAMEELARTKGTSSQLSFQSSSASSKMSLMQSCLVKQAQLIKILQQQVRENNASSLDEEKF